MNLGRINLITPPDTLFNNDLTYLLVKPSTKIKVQFQTILSAIDQDVNVYIYDTDEIDIQWMLNAANGADVIIVDIDNCDPITKNFVALLLANKAFYLTNDELTPWGLISRNRIYNLDWIVDSLKEQSDNQDDEEEEEDEGEQ